MSCKKFNTG